MLFSRSSRPLTQGPSFIERLLAIAGSSSQQHTAGFENLEPRQLLAATVVNPIEDLTVNMNSPGTVIALAPRITDPALNGNIIKFASNMGDVYVMLFNDAAPQTVTNFMQYVNSAAGSSFSWNDTIIHRSVPGFVIQGGGYRYVGGDDVVSSIGSYPPVNNEFRPNTNGRGTIAMAKLGSNPNSATNQWFFNLADNNSTLDPQNGGFTSFGRVLGDGMTIIDAMAAVPRFNLGGAFDNTPLRNYTSGADFVRENFVYFSSITLTARMTYTVTVEDPTKVSAQIIDGNLSLSYLANASGSTTVTVTGTSRDGGPSVSDTFVVNIGPPSVVTAVASAPMVQPGVAFNMSVTGASDQGGTVAAIQYWRDVDGNGAFDSAVDSLVATATSSDNNWQASIATGGVASGLHTYFARPQDNAGIFGTAVGTQVRINANPTLGGVVSSVGSIAVGQNFDLSVVDAADTDDRITRVRYYRDANGNGTLELGTDIELGDSTSSGSNFRDTVRATNFPFGVVTILARATDDFGATSNVVSTTVAVTLSAPTLSSVRATPTVIPDTASPVVLTASGYRDSDGTVVGVQYWRDNGDGIFNEETDTLLGESTTASGGYRFEAQSTGLEPGTYTFFARARDNTDLFSDPASTTARLNAAPTIEALSPSEEVVERLSFFTLTASGVTDDAGVTAVTFYRDADGNGEFDSSIDRSIGRGKRNADGTWSLRVSTRGFDAGVNTFFAIATDTNRGNSGAAITTATVVNAAPTAAGLVSKPIVIANQGDDVTLTIRSPKDRDGTIDRVQYFLDVNGDGAVNLDGENPDLLLGESNSRGFSFTTSTGSFIVGTNFVIARAVDNDGALSDVVGVSVRINAIPTIESVTPDAESVERLSFFTLTANGVADDNLVTAVTFYRDADANGEFDASIDRSIGRGKRNPDGSWSLRVSTRGFDNGANTFFAIATDSNRGTSEPVSGSAFIVNAAPTAAGLVAKPIVIANQGDNVTLTIRSPKDRDGTVVRVQYFLDVNDDGVVNTEGETPDLFLGESTDRGFSLTTGTGLFAIGVNNVLARAIDNDGDVSDPVGGRVRINAVPTIESVTADADSVERLAFFTLTANGVADDTLITAVTFYRDVDGNGEFDASVDRSVGRGKRNADGSWSVRVATKGFDTGTNTFFAVASDRDKGTSAPVAGSIQVVNAAPTVAGLSARPTVVVNQGDDVALSVRTAKDRDGSIERAQYFLDVNGDGVINTEGENPDIMLGEGFSRGYGATISSDAFSLGNNAVLAYVIDNDGEVSAPVGVQVVVNAPPLIESLSVPDTSVNNNVPFTLAALNVLDANGFVSTVDFYIDTDGNGTFTLGVDRSLGRGVNVSGTWSLTTSIRNFDAGTYTVFARATDNLRGVGNVVSGTILVA